MLLGWGRMKKVQNTGEPMPNFFLGVDFIVFPFLFFFNFKNPSHKGSAVFLNIGLTQTCIAIDPFPIIGFYLYHVISADQSNNWTTSGI